ncbi:carbon-nitrogen hydrolase family protein [Larkinella insperata]|uniref:Carbon-nitrogen hydrolase family protein n=1 Tax=Larkinella insperata TaxID=332158 RepID=A0ABW3QBD1_9BACT|nr:carbon-nitrogen hydrolase family protein [Larkinella insperata]
MRISVAQTRPVKGDISRNIDHHQRFIDLAAAHGADVLVFPELSITGYEPTLAGELATTPDDPRFAVFQQRSDAHNLTLGIGVPTRNEAGVCITMVLFHPNQPWQTYAKKYLHADEEPFFVSGRNASVVLRNKPEVALAICYELSVPEHAADAHQTGATLYLASIAKTASGVQKAAQILSDIAKTYAMTVLMANSVGPSDDFVSGGKTAIWSTRGDLLAQLSDTGEGMLLFDTETQKVSSLLL